MQTRKHLRRSRRHISAGALGAQESLKLRLRRTAADRRGGTGRETASHALAVLTSHGWSDAGWEALGLPARTRTHGLGVLR